MFRQAEGWVYRLVNFFGSFVLFFWFHRVVYHQRRRRHRKEDRQRRRRRRLEETEPKEGDKKNTLVKEIKRGDELDGG